MRSQGLRERDAKTASRQSRGKRRQDCYRVREARGLERAGRGIELEKRSCHPATQDAAIADESSNAYEPSTSVKHAATKSWRLSVEQQNEEDDSSK